MRLLFTQLAGTLGAALSAACCLGIPVILSALGALGVGFLLTDANLFPLFIGFCSGTLWLLWRSARQRGHLGPFWLALTGVLLGGIGLWLMIIHAAPLTWTVYLGLAMLLGGSIWNYVAGVRSNSATASCAIPEMPVAADLQEDGETIPEQHSVAHSVVRGIILSIAVTTAFYGLHTSVELLAKQAEVEKIACVGLDACTGLNDCHGLGYRYLTPKQCYIQGGTPLTGSPASQSAVNQ